MWQIAYEPATRRPAPGTYPLVQPPWQTVAELEYRGASTTFDAVLRFTGRGSLTDVAANRGRGLYIVERRGQPLYVGITDTTFGERWRSRLRVFRELRLPLPGAEYAVILAEVRPTRATGAVTRSAQGALLRGVEAAVVRTLVRAGRSLTNTHFGGTDTLPLGAGDRIQLAILSTPSKPAYLPPAIAIAGPQRFEVDDFEVDERWSPNAPRPGAR